MSAFICGPDHFKALAMFAARRQHGSWIVDPRYIDGLTHPEAALRGIENLNDYELATLYADTLYRENVRSVAYRYPDCARDNLPGPLADAGFVDVSPRDLARRDLLLQPVEILKMCDCLEYQSCETKDWPASVAHRLLNAIRRAAVRALPGYEDAPWDFWPKERKAA